MLPSAKLVPVATASSSARRGSGRILAVGSPSNVGLDLVYVASTCQGQSWCGRYPGGSLAAYLARALIRDPVLAGRCAEESAQLIRDRNARYSLSGDTVQTLCSA